MSTLHFADVSRDLVANQRSVDAAGLIAALIRTNGTTLRALDDFAKRSPDGRRRLEPFLTPRAVVPPGTSSDAAWAGPLAHGSPIPNLIVEAARALAVLTRMPVVVVPFGVPIAVQTGAAPIAAFIGEGVPIPAAKLSFASATVLPAKIGLIVPLAAELVKIGNSAGDSAIRNDLAAGIAAGVDTILLGTSAPVATVTPGGIFNGVTPLTPSGTTGAACAKDAVAVVDAHLTNVADVSKSVFLCSPNTASILEGQFPLESLTVLGGSFRGLPALVSASVGNKIACVDCGRLLVSDDGLELDVSHFATIQMDDAATTATAATVVTSFWECDIVGVKAIRFVSWKWGTAAPQAVFVGPTAYVPGT